MNKAKKKKNKLATLPKDCALDEIIKSRLDKGEAPLIVVVGGTGKGKSMTALIIAQHFLARYFNKDFDFENNMFFDVLDLSEKLQNTSQGVIYLEEAGVSLNADEWASDFNKVYNRIQQTQRFRNNLYILVLPHVRFLAKAHRYFITLMIKKTNKKTAVVYGVNVDEADLEGKYVRRSTIEYLTNIPLPSEETIKQFEKHDHKNKQKMLEDWTKDLKRRKGDFSDDLRESNKALKEAINKYYKE